jgi:hypothetical protein
VKLSGNQVAQHRFLWDLAPGECAYVGGLGSGKSWSGARKLLLRHQRNRCPGLAAAPTYGDLFRFVVPALVAACQEWHWPYEDKTRDKVPRLVVGGIEIHTLSCEDPSRFAGFEVGHVWLDEAARIKTDETNPLRDAPTQIRGRIRHPHAQALAFDVTTTPEGLDTWVERDFVANPGKRRFYRGSTRKNSALPPSYLQSLLGSMSPELVRQYVEGEAVDFAGSRAHPQFGDANILAFETDPRLPVHLGADYNVDPMGWCVAQIIGDEIRVFDEIFLTGGTTVDVAMYQANDQGWGKFPAIHLHPDASSKARSTTGDSEFAEMAKTARALGWRWTGQPSSINPPVAARIANLSRLCLDALGRRRLTIHPRCVRLIDEMKRTGRLTSGAYDPGPKGDRGHILDALGYLAWTAAMPTPRAGAVQIAL